MKVYLNPKGEYLKMAETSSHGSTKVYYPSWVPLCEATLFPQTHKLESINWKDQAPVIVATLHANETRTVTIEKEQVE